jgi:hypothetical protein
MNHFMMFISILRQWSDRAQLLHDRVEVGHAPVLGNLTVDDAHCIDSLEADFDACAGDAEKIPSMRAVISLKGGNHVAFARCQCISGVKSGKASRKRL